MGSPVPAMSNRLPRDIVASASRPVTWMRRSCSSVGGCSAIVYVAALQVDQHDVDRRARHAGQLHDRAQLAGVFDGEAFGNPNQLTSDRRCRRGARECSATDHRLIGVLADVARDLRRLGDDVALALRPLHRIVEQAFTVHDRGQRQLIALLFDRDRFRHADVVLTGRGARLVADDDPAWPVSAQFVVGEADTRSGLWIGDERDLIERTRPIDEALRGRHDRTQRAGPDVDLIDREDDLPAVGRVRLLV